MSLWKTILIACILLALLWLLSPYRSPKVSLEPEVTPIVFMGPGGPLSGAMDDAVRAFEEESRRAHQQDPSRPIYRVISGQTGARDQVADPTRFLISVAGGMPPDVIYFDRFAVAEWASRGAFLPLDEFIERDQSENHPDAILPESFYESCWNEALYEGKVYGIPNSVDARALFYNKDLFRRAGLVDEMGEPVPPRNWDELREYAQRLTERDERNNIRVLGFAPNYGNSWLYMFGWMNNATFLSEDGTRCLLNEERVVEALQFMVDIYDDAGGYQSVLAYQAGFQGGALDPFITGKVAMKIDGYFYMPHLAQFGRDLNFGVAPPPVSERMIQETGETSVSWSGGWSYAIPINALHQEAAWEFIRFMMSERAMKIMLESEREAVEAQGRLFIPAQNPIQDFNEWVIEHYILDNPRMPQRLKEGAVVFSDLLPNSRFRPITPVGQLMWNRQVIAMEEAGYGRRTPQQTLDHGAGIVQRRLDQVLAPPFGEPITDWTFFFVSYGLLLIAIVVLVYLWDTHVAMRRRLRGIFHFWRKTDAGRVIEGSRGGYFRQQWWAGFLFALPWIIGFVVFGGGPLLYSILMSFCDYDVIQPARWIGLYNYRYLFTTDELLPVALYNTLFMVIGIPIGLVLSLALALLLNVEIRGISVWRTFFYLPAIVPAVAVFILFIWIYNPEGGILNTLLGVVGIRGPNWLQDPRWVKPSLILMGLWGAGGGMLIWLAGLKGISTQYYEAASMDGANMLQRFRYITLPMLTPYIFFNMVMGMIGVFQIFEVSFIMTEGGPVNSTLFYVYHLFNNAFRFGRMGYASAMAWILFILILGFTIVQLRLAKVWVHYESE